MLYPLFSFQSNIATGHLFGGQVSSAMGDVEATPALIFVTCGRNGPQGGLAGRGKRAIMEADEETGGLRWQWRWLQQAQKQARNFRPRGFRACFSPW